MDVAREFAGTRKMSELLVGPEAFCTATTPNREKFLTMLDKCYQRDQLFSDWFATFMRHATDYRALHGELTGEMLQWNEVGPAKGSGLPGVE